MPQGYITGYLGEATLVKVVSEPSSQGDIYKELILARYMNNGRKSISGRGTQSAKAGRQERARYFTGSERRLVWIVQSAERGVSSGLGRQPNHVDLQGHSRKMKCLNFILRKWEMTLKIFKQGNFMTQFSFFKDRFALQVEKDERGYIGETGRLVGSCSSQEGQGWLRFSPQYCQHFGIIAHFCDTLFFNYVI